MGVGSSREIEEQLEAALSLLDAARSKQEHLKAECENLQSRITSQSAALLKEEQAKALGAIHLVQQRDPLSKRVLFGLAVTTPLACHTLFSAIAIQIVDFYALMQGIVLCAVVVLMLRFRRYRWRRIRPERITMTRDGQMTPSGGEPGSPRASGSAAHPPPIQVGEVEVQPAHLMALMATEAELDVLREVKANLQREPPPLERGGELLPTHEPLLDVQLIRFLKEHGPHVNKIESCYRRALEWRAKNLPLKQIPQTEDPSHWLSAADMTHGVWATQYAYIGLYCGRSKIGCPVKIERLGKYNLEELQRSDPDYRKKFNHFYLSLIEFLQQRLDHYTLQEGRLVQTYEIFDLAGLGYHVLTMAVINFAKDILVNFSTHYPSSFRKAVILNAPSFLPPFWRMVSSVLPKSVTAKVNILGTDYYKTLTEELGEEALAWIEANNYDLARAPHKPSEPAAASAQAAGGSENDEPLDGEPVVVEDD